jgi:hypothetical protein
VLTKNLGRRDRSFFLLLVMLVGLVPLVVVQVVGMLILVVVCLLEAFHLEINTSLGELADLSMRGLRTTLSLSWCSYSFNETCEDSPWWL